MTIVPPAPDGAEPPTPDPSEHVVTSTIAADLRALAELFERTEFTLVPTKLNVQLHVLGHDTATPVARRQTIDALSVLMSGQHARYVEEISHHRGERVPWLPARTEAYAFGKVGPSAAQIEAQRQAELRALIVRAASFIDVDAPATAQCPAAWYGTLCPDEVVGGDGRCATHTDPAESDEVTAELPAYVPSVQPTGDIANRATAAQLNAPAAGEATAAPARGDYGDELLVRPDVTQPERELLEALYRTGASELVTHDPEMVSGMQRAGLVCLLRVERPGVRPRFRLTDAGLVLAVDLFRDLPIPFMPVESSARVADLAGDVVSELDHELAALADMACPVCCRPMPAGVSECPSCTFRQGGKR